jgi:hypothetical protein
VSKRKRTENEKMERGKFSKSTKSINNRREKRSK